MKAILITALVLFAAPAFATTTETKTTTTTTDGAPSVAPSTTGDQTTTTHATTGASAKADGFNLIHVADLASMKKSSQVYIFDANNDKTRKLDGVIPGAKALANVTGYNVAQTLPADKSAHVVFYCANTMCMASHGAAKRAVAAGYQNVSVMADGIEGWKKSGQPTEKFSSAKSIYN